MTIRTQSPPGRWSSAWLFILAATGSAVGLGNIWKFPYITGENGGGAFVLFYLFCILLVGIPVMMSEILIGRRGRQNPANSAATVALESGRSRRWQIFGAMGIIAGFLMLSFYVVVAGWALDYIFLAAKGDFHHTTSQQVNALFAHLVASPMQLLFWSTCILLATAYVVACGVNKGLERFVRLLLPSLLVLLLVLVGYAMSSGQFAKGLHFLFHPNFHELTPKAMLTALGHAFFTLSLASGAIMMYGAYLPREISIVRTSITIALADTLIALIAGLAIFPVVFANQLAPGAGPGLIFQTLPLAFAQLPYGSFFACLFFIMLVFAALTSSISLLEPAIAWLMENIHYSRFKATVFMSFVIWLLSLGTIFSFNYGAQVKIFGLTFFDLMDYITANLMLPIAGLLTAIFVAWFMKKDCLLDELAMKDGMVFKCFYYSLRFITPLAILAVLVFELF